LMFFFYIFHPNPNPMTNRAFRSESCPLLVWE
jgi:hypothetical protein